MPANARPLTARSPTNLSQVGVAPLTFGNLVGTMPADNKHAPLGTLLVDFFGKGREIGANVRGSGRYAWASAVATA